MQSGQLRLGWLQPTHAFFHFLARLEGDHEFGRDIDRIVGAWIASAARLAQLHLEHTEIAQLNPPIGPREAKTDLVQSPVRVLRKFRDKLGSISISGAFGVKLANSAFVDFFRPGDGADPNDYPAGIPQVLRLMNSEWTANTSAFVRQSVKLDQPAARNLEALYLATLSRRPSDAESRRLTQYLQDGAGQPAKAYGDILWALLNSSEFRLNH